MTATISAVKICTASSAEWVHTPEFLAAGADEVTLPAPTTALISGGSTTEKDESAVIPWRARVVSQSVLRKSNLTAREHLLYVIHYSTKIEHIVILYLCHVISA